MMLTEIVRINKIRTELISFISFICMFRLFITSFLENQAPKHNSTIAEEAVTPKHELVEVEIVGETLGSKYYENTKKPQLIEADSKDIPTPNVEASAKVAKPSDRKVEEVQKTEKKVEKKAEKGKNKFQKFLNFTMLLFRLK